MCFSAPASFVSGAIITSIGAATLHKNTEPSKRTFAAIPLIFGIQQVSEGFVWLTLLSPGHDLVLRMATNLFLILALVIWPTMLPLSIFLMERSQKARKTLSPFLAAGMFLSLCYGAGMLIFNATAQIAGYHILYTIGFPQQFKNVAEILYLMATVGPLFISSTRRVYWFGIVILLSYLVTSVFYREYLISVWCFFAALASLVIWSIINESSVENRRAWQPVSEQ